MTKCHRRPLFIAIGAVASILLSSSVQAGEILRFAKGNVNVRAQAQALTQEPDRQIWIAQFRAPITRRDQKDLRSIAKVFRYLPDDALVVRGSRAQIQSVLGERLNGMLPYRGSFKLSDTLPTVSVLMAGQRDIVSVTLIDESETENFWAAVSHLDPQARIVQSQGRFLDLGIRLTAVPSMASIQSVEFVESRPEIKTMQMPFEVSAGEAHAMVGDFTDLSGYESGTKLMNFESAWSAGLNGAGQIVGIGDTGLDTGDTRTIASDFSGAVYKGYALGVGANTWEDPMGHGTHVAGSVAGRGNQSQGKVHGGATAAQVIMEGLWSPIIDNLTLPPKLANLFDPAYQDGARIHTNSWGAAANFGAYDSMAVQADEYLWNHPDMMILFAAGNSGVDKDANGVIDPNSVGTPGTAKNVLTVGASKNLVSVGGIQKQIKELKTAKESWPAEPISSSKLSDNPNGIACFSSRGPTKDGRLKPEIVAPGTNILSDASHTTSAQKLWGAYNADYNFSGGTSMATPLAAGASALVREMLMKKFQIANPSGALVKAYLMHTAKDLFPGQFGQGTPTQELQLRPNNDEGYGRVDMARAVALGAGTHLVDSEGVGTGENFAVEIKLAQGQKLLANLVYFDAPGSSSAAQALVNNLDLVLLDGSGRETGSHDRLNNHEVLELSSLSAGTYHLQVKGANVPMGKNGKQPFALIYTIE